MTLTLTATPLALPLLILLFGLIHFKWLKWITIPDDEGHLESHFFLSDRKKPVIPACVFMPVSVRGEEV